MPNAGCMNDRRGVLLEATQARIRTPCTGNPEWNLATREDENSSKERAARVCLRTYFHLYTLCISISILIDGAHLTA
jgi:hypothetical protein